MPRLSNVPADIEHVRRFGAELREDRRKEPRLEEDTPARLKILHPLISMGPSIHARILNRSASGVKLRVPHSVFVGALVLVRLPDGIVFGKVRYCISAGAEYQVGVYLKDNY